MSFLGNITSKIKGKNNVRNHLIKKMSSSPVKHIHVETGHDTFDLTGYTCELSANAFVPPTRRTVPKERNFFNSHKEVMIYLNN